MKKRDYLNKKFGRLSVISESEPKNGKRYFLCQCDCGNLSIVEGSKLASGKTKSCGCLKVETIRRQRRENEYEFVDDYVKVKLKDDVFMLCDRDDWERLKTHHWHINALGYASSGTMKEGTLIFHKMVTNTTHEVIDHINRNKLDNRKKNLRVANKKINSINRDLQSNNTTGVKGVYLNKRNKTWHARVTVDGKTIYLGTYSTKEDAIRARKAGELKYYAPQMEIVC